MKQVLFQRHLVDILNGILDFLEPLQNMFIKVNKAIGLFRKLQNNKPRASLVTTYKSFIWPHLDYGYLLYDRTFIVCR